MNVVYLVVFDSATWVVEATSFSEAVALWKQCVYRDPEFDGDEEPDEVRREYNWFIVERVP